MNGTQLQFSPTVLVNKDKDQMYVSKYQITTTFEN